MTDFLQTLKNLRRPRLLIRAARHGVMDYNRNRDLQRILRGQGLPGPSRTVPRLMDMEAEFENARRTGDAGYSIMRHIEVLIALMSEARMLA